MSKSSLFCLFLLRNHFSALYVTKKLQKIAQIFNAYRRKDREQDRIFKAMLRFSFVEQLMPNTNKKGNLKKYYEDLKISVPWLKNDPHFWLQNGMANITFKEYQKAQKFIDQAYALAGQKQDNYDISNIDTQQARLFILLAIKEHDNAKIYELFNKADRLLSKLKNDVYKYRQVDKYRDFYEASFSKLSAPNRINFKKACLKMLKDIEFAEIGGEIEVNRQKTIKKAKNNISFVVSMID